MSKKHLLGWPLTVIGGIWALIVVARCFRILIEAPGASEFAPLDIFMAMLLIAVALPPGLLILLGGVAALSGWRFSRGIGRLFGAGTGLWAGFVLFFTLVRFVSDLSYQVALYPIILVLVAVGYIIGVALGEPTP